MPFPPAERLTGDSIRIDEVLFPLQMAKIGDKVVVQSIKTDSLFFVYGLPDFRFLYSTGSKGEGPDDFAYPMKMSVTPSEKLLISSQGKLKNTFVRVTDTGFVMEKQLPMPPSCKMMGMADDSTGVMDRNLMKLELIDVNTMETMDTVRDLKSVITNDGAYSNLNYGALYGRKMFFVYSEMDLVEFYRISPDGRFEHTASYGTDSVYVRRPYHYPYGPHMSMTENYVFVRFIDMENNRRQLIRVFDWDGHPVKTFDLGRRYFDVFTVDQDSRTIYAADNSRDFDYIYTFRYSLE